METATPEEVCRAVSLDLKSRGYTHEGIAKEIGKSRAIVANVLSSRKRFSKQMASLFSRAFNYNIGYLLFGEGELKARSTIKDFAFIPSVGKYDGTMLHVSTLASLLDVAGGILRVIGDEEALKAWDSINNGDFDEFIEHMENLSSSHENRRYSPILAKYACDNIKTTMYLPIREVSFSVTGKKPSE